MAHEILCQLAGTAPAKASLVRSAAAGVSEVQSPTPQHFMWNARWRNLTGAIVLEAAFFRMWAELYPSRGGDYREIFVEVIARQAAEVSLAREAAR